MLSIADDGSGTDSGQDLPSPASKRSIYILSINLIEPRSLKCIIAFFRRSSATNKCKFEIVRKSISYRDCNNVQGFFPGREKFA